MIRVLHVVDTLERGGAESMIMNLYRHTDNAQIQFDFVVHTDDRSGYYSDIIDLGGYIYTAPRFNGKNIQKYIEWWDAFLSNHEEYKIVHGHMRSCASLYLALAKKKGRITIAHSHSTSNGKGISAVVKAIMQYPLRYQADYFLACSKESAEWLFGENVANTNKCYILRNAIDLSEFSFDVNARKDYRKRLGIAEHQLVICHVGNFTEAKNHRYVIELFHELIKLNPTSVLLLIGTGTVKQIENVQRMILEYRLQNKVLLLGARNDVPQILCAADAFVFPSKWEGFGIAALEAQAAGLQTFISDSVPREVGMTQLAHFLPINVNASIWAKSIVKSKLWHIDVQNDIRSAGYAIEDNAKWLAEFYKDISRQDMNL